MSTVRVGIAGYGTVGRATAQILAAQPERIAARCGARLEVTAVCRRTPVAADKAPVGARVYRDWRELVASPDVDIVVETIGGTDAARAVVRAALTAGKPVVTANKNLLAAHGEELLELAARIPLRPTTVPYTFDDAPRALADLAHDRVNGAAVIRVD